MLPADQRLQPDDASGLDVDLGLVMQQQLVSVDAAPGDPPPACAALFSCPPTVIFTVAFRTWMSNSTAIVFLSSFLLV